MDAALAFAAAEDDSNAPKSLLHQKLTEKNRELARRAAAWTDAEVGGVSRRAADLAAAAAGETSAHVEGAAASAVRAAHHCAETLAVMEECIKEAEKVNFPTR